MTDTFRGDNAALVSSIKALLALDADGALVPHGIGGHARGLLEAAACRLADQPATIEMVGDPMDGADRSIALNRVVWKLAEAMGRVPEGAEKIEIRISEVVNAACESLSA